MCTIAVWRYACAFALAKGNFIGWRDFRRDGFDSGARVRTVAEGLIARPATGAPVVAAGLQGNYRRLFHGDVCLIHDATLVLDFNTVRPFCKLLASTFDRNPDLDIFRGGAEHTAFLHAVIGKMQRGGALKTATESAPWILTAADLGDNENIQKF